MGIGEDIANALNPATNGVGDFFKNDVGSFFKNDFMGFIKGDVLPITKSFLDITVQSIMLPMELINNAFRAGSNILSGNGIYILVFGVAGIAVLGGVMYYKK
jgi:hypothetical protein